MTPKERPDISFDEELAQGPDSYNGQVGDWWNSRSCDMAHRRAYASIAGIAKLEWESRSRKAPSLVLDYACGTGRLLGTLRKSFPFSTLAGVDAAPAMLDLAASNLTDPRRISAKQLAAAGKVTLLAQSNLPDFRLPKGIANIVTLSFPNLVPDPSQLEVFDRNGYGNTADNKVARALAEEREPEAWMETAPHDPESTFDELMTHRVYSRNLRGLLRTGGLLLRAEYANSPLGHLTDLVRRRSLFGEGALSTGKPFFRFLGAHWRRSSVIKDVFHQTGDPTDGVGGYNIAVFKAI